MRKPSATMKPGVMIVNCARGGIINEGDLCDAFKTKRVAAAAFDVFEEEPVKPDNPLLSLDNFICTPHIGAQTTEAQENVAVGIAEQIVDYFTKGVAKRGGEYSVCPSGIAAEAAALSVVG